MTSKETKLTGGNTNAAVVRIGQTVRRQMSRSSSTVHRLLSHLERSGYSSCPRFLGVDRQGREILSYIEGESGFTEDLWKREEPLIATANMLRGLHDATRSFVRTKDDLWAMNHSAASGQEVICHHDFAPYNFIFDAGIPIAVIDFDLAGPGPGLWDVAYAAYWLTPLAFGAADLRRFAHADLRAGCRRLKLFCDTYGVSADRALLDMVEQVLAHMASPEAAVRTVGQAAADSLERGGHFEYWHAEKASFGSIKPELLQHLH